MENEYLSCIYLTRKCPRKCEYCRIRDSKLEKELTPEQWVEALHILKDFGVHFNLLLGNEPFMLGEGLSTVISGIKDLNYAMYSSAPKDMFDKYSKQVLDAGLKNYSIPVDFVNVETDYEGDIKDKSLTGLDNLLQMREMGVPEVLGVITVHKKNYMHLEKIVEKMNSLGVPVGLNVIHWDIDGKFDFFPPKPELEEYTLSEEDKENIKPILRRLMEHKLNDGWLIQNDIRWFENFLNFCELNWHCKKDGILTLDADGSFRICAYRKGEHISKYNVFNFQDDLEGFFEAMHKDKEECPGCFWSYCYISELQEDTRNFVDLNRVFKK